MTGRRDVCEREGCERIIRNGDYTTCCLLCRAVVQELRDAENVCSAIRSTPHWMAAVDLNEAVTALYESERRLRRVALESGITPEQWRAIKIG